MEGEDTRSRLYAAAVAAFGAKGFHATTTRDIASAAGLSPAALYVHHRSKESLLYEVCLTGHQVMLETMTTAVAGAGERPADRLAALMRAWVIEHARAQDAARVVNDELGALSPAHRAQVDALRTAMESIARDIVESGVAAGDFHSSDPHLTARAVLSLGQDVAHWFRPGGRWTPEAIASEYADLALRMVGSTPR